MGWQLLTLLIQMSFVTWKVKFFDQMVHWQLLTPERDELIYDKLRDKDWYNFYANVESGDARQEDHNPHAKKLKYK